MTTKTKTTLTTVPVSLQPLCKWGLGFEERSERAMVARMVRIGRVLSDGKIKEMRNEAHCNAFHFTPTR